jgi:hypothetical protein
LNRGISLNQETFTSAWSSGTSSGRIAIPDHEEQAKPLLPEDFELPKSPAEPEVIFERKSDDDPVGPHEGQASLIYPG